jgi:hypothetical protein
LCHIKVHKKIRKEKITSEKMSYQTMMPVTSPNKRHRNTYRSIKKNEFQIVLKIRNEELHE